MYTLNENHQALQSQHLITSALLSLMATYAYEEITITQICQEAQVSRQTFYRNFEFKNDILDFHLNNLIHGYLSTFPNNEADSFQHLYGLFVFLQGYKDFLKLLKQNNLFFLLNQAIVTNILSFSSTEKLAESDKEINLNSYVLDFIASTICSIISRWIENDFKESSQTLAKLMQKFLSVIHGWRV